MELSEFIEIKEYKKSRVIIGKHLIKKVIDYIPKNKSLVIIITDVNVREIYGNKFPNYPIVVIQTGEASKTQKTVDFIIEELLTLGADRHSFLLGIGGGLVCDITGYVASIFMRGIKFGYFSTTLLAQIDASIGGKTGINFKGLKNMIGVFNHPEFVLCDISFLKTLTQKEIKNGLIEAIKHAVINDNEAFFYIKSNLEKILSVDTHILQYLVERSIRTKMTIVDKDEYEQNQRKKLNLGHTIGHAIELKASMPHGYAVGIGLIMAAKISHYLGFCKRQIVSDIIDLISFLKLPVSTDIEITDLTSIIKKDKKKNKDKIDFVVIKKIGNVVVSSLSFKDLEKIMQIVK